VTTRQHVTVTQSYDRFEIVTSIILNVIFGLSGLPHRACTTCVYYQIMKYTDLNRVVVAHTNVLVPPLAFVFDIVCQQTPTGVA
jgi:hypothetical protein